MHLEDLPTEILVNIISLLPLDSLLTLSEVSKYFYTLVNSELQSGKIPIDLEINEDFYQKQPKVSYEINQIGKKTMYLFSPNTQIFILKHSNFYSYRIQAWE